MNNRKEEFVTVRLTPATKKEIILLADYNGLKISDIIREAINFYLLYVNQKEV